MLFGKLIKCAGLLGFDDVQFELGKVTVVQGRNALGKTSFIEGLRAALGYGVDATLVRNGAGAAEAVLLLEDGTTLKRRVPKDGRPTLTLKKPGAAKPEPSPQARLEELRDFIAVNPVTFRSGKPQDRIEALLTAIDLKVDPSRLAEACGDNPGDPQVLARYTQLCDRGHAFDAIDALHAERYKTRTLVNRDVDRAKATIESLSRGLPPIPDTPLDAEVADLECELVKVREDLYRAKSAAQVALNNARSQAELVHSEKVKKLRERRQRALDRIEQICKRAMLAYRNEQDAVCAQVQAEYVAYLNQAQESFGPEIERLTGQIAGKRAEQLEQERAAERRGEIARLHDERAKAEAESDALTAALDRLKLLKLSLLEQLPVPGMEIRGEEIYVDGIAFPRLNTQRQFDIAFTIAELRAKKLAESQPDAIGMVCIDGAEVLDSWEFEAFLERAQASPVQVIVTRVTDGPFEVVAK